MERRILFSSLLSCNSVFLLFRSSSPLLLWTTEKYQRIMHSCLFKFCFFPEFPTRLDHFLSPKHSLYLLFRFSFSYSLLLFRSPLFPFFSLSIFGFYFHFSYIYR